MEDRPIQMSGKEVDIDNLPKVLDLEDTEGQSPEDMAVIRLSALREFGVPEEAINRLMEAQVLRGHWRSTCGDYNLV